METKSMIENSSSPSTTGGGSQSPATLTRGRLKIEPEVPESRKYSERVAGRKPRRVRTSPTGKAEKNRAETAPAGKGTPSSSKSMSDAKKSILPATPSTSDETARKSSKSPVEGADTQDREAKKSEARKVKSKKRSSKKPEPKKPEPKKPEAKKAEAKKPEAKKAEAKKAEAKKAEAKKAEVKKPTAKKPEVKKPTATRPEAKKAEAKKHAAKQAEDKKPEVGPASAGPASGHAPEAVSLNLDQLARAVTGPLSNRIDDRTRVLEERLAALEEKIPALEPVVSSDPENFDEDIDQVGRVMKRTLVDLVERHDERWTRPLADIGRSLEGLRLRAHSESNPMTEDLDRCLEGIATVLDEVGVEKYDGVRGDPFDPLIHQLVGTRSEAESPEGSILEVRRPGYRSPNGRVLFPAQVIVNRR